jgi:hypothetical protein
MQSYGEIFETLLLELESIYGSFFEKVVRRRRRADTFSPK